MSANEHLGPQFAYQDGHRPPAPDYGASMHNVEEVFPDYHEMPHVYSSGLHPSQFPHGSPERDFATRSRRADQESHRAMTVAKAQPNADIEVFRATPRNEINPGDWVTPSKTYAEHRDSNGESDWHIASRTVKAKHLFSEGNSIAEWGWHPHGSE